MDNRLLVTTVTVGRRMGEIGEGIKRYKLQIIKQVNHRNGSTTWRI